MDHSDSDRPGTSLTSKRMLKSKPKIAPIVIDACDSTQRPNTQNLHSPLSDRESTRVVLKQLTMKSSKDRFLFRQNPHDIETLQDELIATKKELNTYKEQLSKLKIKTVNQEGELNKISKMSLRSDFRSTIDTYYKEDEVTAQTEAKHFVISLKNKVNELQIQLNQKDQQIQQLIRNQKTLIHRELFAENQSLKNELIRLQTMLKSSISLSLEIQNKEAHTIIDTLKNDNIEMTALVKQLSMSKIELERQLSNANRQLQKAITEKNNMQKVKAVMEKEIEDLKQRDPYGQIKKQWQMTEKQLRAEIDQKFQECNELNHAVQNREKKISELEKKIRELFQENQQKSRESENEISALKEKLQSLKEELLNNSFNTPVNQKRRTLNRTSTTTFEEGSKKRLFSTKNLELIAQESESQNAEDSVLSEPPQYQVYTVQKSDVVDIGLIMRFKLRERGLSSSDLEEYLTESEEQVSIDGLKYHFILPPFELSQGDALILARYIVEDNENQTILFDPGSKTSWIRAKSILRHVIGEGIILDSHAKELLRQQICKAFKRSRYNIEQYFENMKVNLNTICEQSQFEEAMRNSDCQLSPPAFDYLLFKNYFFCGQSLHLIDIQQTLNYFYESEASLAHSEMQNSNLQMGDHQGCNLHQKTKSFDSQRKSETGRATPDDL